MLPPQKQKATFYGVPILMCDPGFSFPSRRYPNLLFPYASWPDPESYTYWAYPRQYYDPQTLCTDETGFPDLYQSYSGAMLRNLSDGPGPFKPSVFVGNIRGDVRDSRGRKVPVCPTLLYSGVCPPQFSFKKTSIRGLYALECLSECPTINKTQAQCNSCGNGGLVPRFGI